MSFWDVHGAAGGLLFLFFLFFLPRLTLAFLALLTGAIGITFWGLIGWIIFPRILVAIIGTSIYWETNTALCALAWIAAFMGESGEKSGAKMATTTRG